jgi:hypothetical protein
MNREAGRRDELPLLDFIRLPRSALPAPCSILFSERHFGSADALLGLLCG